MKTERSMWWGISHKDKMAMKREDRAMTKRSDFEFRQVRMWRGRQVKDGGNVVTQVKHKHARVWRRLRP